MLLMNTDLSIFIKQNEIVAVALSGGEDSVALLHFLLSRSSLLGFKVIALNVEHGIRGEDSLSDTNFVKELCRRLNVELICYSVDSLSKAQTDKLSVEQAARALRYECFYRAIAEGKCDKVATAHHRRDNVESVLFNLFRGSGLKGVSGITPCYDGKIIRPL